MSVYKYHGSWWVDFAHRGARFRRRSPLNTAAGARDYEALLRQRLAHGESIDLRSSPAFDEFAAMFLRDYAVTNNKLSEQLSKKTVLAKHLGPFFGKAKLSEIRRQDIDRYKARKAGEGFAEKSINNQLMVLSKMLRIAVDWGLLKSAPKVPLFRVNSGRTEFLTPEEIFAMVRVSREPWRTMVLVAWLTGLRRGELLGLHWDDVDREHRVLMVSRALVRGVITTTKSKKPRAVPLGRSTLAALDALPVQQGFVFHQDPTGALTLDESQAAEEMKRIKRLSGVAKAGWHILRHSFASHLVAGGAPMRAVQMLLGHQNVKTTERYAHLAPEFLHDTVNILEGQPVRAPRQQDVNSPSTRGATATLHNPETSLIQTTKRLLAEGVSLVTPPGIEPHGAPDEISPTSAESR